MPVDKITVIIFYVKMVFMNKANLNILPFSHSFKEGN